MTTRGLILIALVSFSEGASASKNQLIKCCPPGKVFWGKAVCNPVPADATELYSVNYDGVSDQSNGFPICEEPEDVATSQLSRLNGTDFLQLPACIEILHAESTNDDTLIGVVCQSKKYGDEVRLKRTWLQMLNVRRCCPKNTEFDLDTKTCLTSSYVAADANFTDSREFLELLPKPLGEMEFLNVPKGTPNCLSGALVTYEIGADDISFENGSLWVTVPSEKDFYEKIPASMEDTCLELTPNSTINRRLVVRVCRKKEFCQNHSCVRKCCPEDQAFDSKNRCSKNSSITTQAFYNEVFTFTNQTWNNTGNGLLIGRSCKNYAYKASLNETYITSEGYVVYNSYILHKHDEYCLDMFIDGFQPLLCFPENTPDYPKIRRLRGKVTGGHSYARRFLLYSIYAWGLALFITLFCIVGDRTSFLGEAMKPNFGVARCWFRNDQFMFGEMIFFRAPVAIQLISNVVFFILTSRHCSKVKAEIRRVADPTDPRSKRFHADKTKLIMNVKLFVVMGITWIAEIASSLMNKYTDYEWKETLFYGSDAINCLHGVMIFILFVLKPRVYQALKRQLGFENKKKCSSQGTSTLNDPAKVKQSASNSTLTSSFANSVAP
ncbi:uncharacterized protein LOC116431129 isoform X2 [Nomia melanderi]|uniref:uncharacterized protein LOC116431129 isoform X2 n=1 Tax=Nomia melanderi TaxID=2448451 RepID=UPI0013041C10|nr:uncharacterized protein LOC116431129 isoform X2 [Nomia melanderi]